VVGDRHGHFFVEEFADDDAAFGGDFGVEAVGQLVRIFRLKGGDEEEKAEVKSRAVDHDDG